MERVPVPFQKIVFVCVNQRAPTEACCAAGEGEAIAAALKTRIKAMGLAGTIRVSKSGCQDLCALGPNVLVSPDHRMYQRVTLADVDRIVEEITRALRPA